jgi:hypothetical protein
MKFDALIKKYKYRLRVYLFYVCIASNGTLDTIAIVWGLVLLFLNDENK